MGRFFEARLWCGRRIENLKSATAESKKGNFKTQLRINVTNSAKMAEHQGVGKRTGQAIC